MTHVQRNRALIFIFIVTKLEETSRHNDTANGNNNRRGERAKRYLTTALFMILNISLTFNVDLLLIQIYFFAPKLKLDLPSEWLKQISQRILPEKLRVAKLDKKFPAF
jgi:hypothetical protein